MNKELVKLAFAAGYARGKEDFTKLAGRKPTRPLALRKNVPMAALADFDPAAKSNAFLADLEAKSNFDPAAIEGIGPDYLGILKALAKDKKTFSMTPHERGARAAARETYPNLFKAPSEPAAEPAAAPSRLSALKALIGEYAGKGKTLIGDYAGKGLAHVKEHKVPYAVGGSAALLALAAALDHKRRQKKQKKALRYAF